MPLTTSPDISPVVQNGEVPLSAVKLTAVLPSGTYDFSQCILSLGEDHAPSSNLPDGIPAEDGETARTASLSLKGAYDPTDETRTVWWLLNPDNSASPMWRQEAKGSEFTLQMGVPVNGADVYVPQWTMIVTSVDNIDPLTGIVQMQLADNTDRFADMSNLPAVLTDEPWNAGLTSEFVLDLIARTTTNGEYSTWPALRPNCVLAAGMRTSVWPQVGALNTAYSWQLPSFAACVNGTGVRTNGTVAYTPSQSFTFSNDLVIEFWANGTTGQAFADIAYDEPASPSTFMTLQVDYDAHTVAAKVISGGGTTDTYTVTGVADGAHYIAAHFSFTSSGGTVAVRVDGTTHTSGVFTAAQWASANRCDVGAGGDTTIEAVQITTESAPAWNDAFAPKVILDESLNPMQTVPAIDTSNHGWDEMQTAAQAEAGVLYLDNTQRLVFRNRDSIDSQSAWRAFTSDQAIETLQTSTGATTQYGRVAIDYTDYTFNPNQTVLAPTGRWKIPAQATGSSAQQWTRKLADGTSCAALSSPAIPWTTDTVNPPNDGQSYYRASNDKYGKNEHAYAGLTVTAAVVTPSEITVTGADATSQDAWLVNPANYLNTTVGAAALWIRGTLVTADSPTTIYSGSGSPTFTFDSNPYRQDRDAAQSLADWLLGQVLAPYPEYSNVALMYDPRLVVSDRITLTDPDVSLVQTDVTVWGRHVSLDRSGAGFDVTMAVDVRPTSRPGSWVMGLTGRSEMGQTTYVY